MLELNDHQGLASTEAAAQASFMHSICTAIEIWHSEDNDAAALLQLAGSR